MCNLCWKACRGLGVGEDAGRPAEAHSAGALNPVTAIDPLAQAVDALADETASAVPWIKPRLRSRRSDSLPTKLIFAEDEISLHQEIHSQGPFRKGWSS